MIVDDVELTGTLVAGERVVKLRNRQPDLLRTAPVSNTETSLAFVCDSPEANSVTSCPASTSPVSKQRDDPFDAAVAGRWDGKPDRTEKPDSHDSSTTTFPPVEPDVPSSCRTRGTPESLSEPAHEGNSPGPFRDERVPAVVGLGAEQQLEEKHGRARGPRLRAGSRSGTAIGNGVSVQGESSEYLRQRSESK